MAIIGIGCRFPGGIEDADSFWEFVLLKGDAVADIPKDRWDADKFYDPDPDTPGRMYTRRASFLAQGFRRFDADFFGISHREAAVLDPQQRLLLETSWEALDDAGIAGQALGGKVGTFIGGFMNDNMISRGLARNLEKINNFAAFSASQTLLSNRIAHALDLWGPSMTVDTACSSSLVTTHLAVRAVANGECDVALAGGVNVMFQPETFITMCKGRFLAADGRCKSFDAAADGYGRGEGVGIVVLKNLEQAQRDGDRIYAVIRGSGVNQDGRTIALPVPNPLSQQRLAEQVLAEAGVDPALVGYVEAHGTGTSVGDPLEAEALGHSYGQAAGRTQSLIIGSVKNNFGHTEAAAGVAGLIKAALTVQRRTIAPQVVLDKLNPQIPFDELRIRVPLEVETYPDLGAPAYAAVNSFGYGGANAHVLVSEPPAQTALEAPVPVRDSIRIFPVSARSGTALHEVAARYAEMLRTDKGAADEASTVSDDYAQRLKTAATGRRAQHHLRKGFIYRDADDLLVQLNSYAESEEAAPPRALVEGISDPVFVFSGMGPQWWGMARGLLECQGVFRDTAADIDAVFQEISGWSVIAELLRSQGDSRVSRTEIAQPANFLVQSALAKHLEQFGIRPTAVVGHSVGEVAAAYVGGALSLRDAATVSFHRSRLQAKTAGSGGMLAVGLDAEEAQRRAARFGTAVCVAAINSAAATTLSGDSAALQTLHDELAGDGIFARMLHVEVPYHSQLMDPILDELATSLAGLTPLPTDIPLYSTVTGEKVNSAAFADPAYWCQNVRESVLFARAVDTLIADRYRVFLEVGPHPVLLGNLRESFVRHSISGAAVQTLHRDQDDEQSVLQAITDLYAVGAIDAPGQADIYEHGVIAHMDLPKYPWSQEEVWEEDPLTLRARYGDADRFALLGDRADALTPQWEVTLAPANLPWLPDHTVLGSVVLPGTAYLDAALSAVRQRSGKGQAGLDSVVFAVPLVVAEHDAPITRITVDEPTKRFIVNGRSAHTQMWTAHANGRLVEANLGTSRIEVPAQSVNDRVFDGQDVYTGLAAVGLSYGPAFQRIQSVRIGSAGCVAQLASLVDGPESGSAPKHAVHPALADAALQCIAVLLAARPELDIPPTAHVPASIDRVRLYHEVPEDPIAVVEITSTQPLRANAYLASRDGEVALAMTGVTLRPVGSASAPLSELEQYFYEPRWEPLEEEVEGQPAAAAPTPVARAANAIIEIGEVAAAVAEGARRAAAAGVAVLSADTVHRADLAETFAAALHRDEFLRVLVTVGSGKSAVDNVDRLVTVAQALRVVLEAETDRGVVSPDVQVVVVSKNAFLAPGDHGLDLDQVALVGARRVLANEQHPAKWSLMDLTDGVTADEVTTEIGAMNRAEEVAVRTGVRWTQRMRRSLPELVAPWEEPFAPTDPDVAYEVQIPDTRTLKDITLRACDRIEPGPRQVEVRIETVGLNYKDPLKVLGILTERELGKTYFKLEPGMEGFGVVTRVGSQVDELRVGESIAVAERGLLRRYLTFDLDGGAAWEPIADVHLQREEFDPLAVGSGVPFFTAGYAFYKLADLQPGETVLVHGAAGGMGMAAVQVAVNMGAVVYATAGSEERRRAALDLGATAAFDSRSIGFVDDILGITEGRGVDVIYNSLPGEMIAQNFAVAGEFCRIIEIGKADIYFGGATDLKPFSGNLSFHSVDMDRMLRMRPEIFRELRRECTEMLTAGKLTPLPYTRFPIDQIVGAFEAVFRAEHMGRIVLDLRDQTPTLLPRKSDPVPVRPGHSYLITGGFGGFGLATARSLARAGATHLILASRSGATTEVARAQIEALRAADVDVWEERIDISDYDQVADLVAKVEASGHPLRGVFHAAAVAHDEVIADISAESLYKVFGPKVSGALNLDRATREHNVQLDHFVLYSSISGLIGIVPQLTYAAANSMLDGLAVSRHAAGLPALSVNWGAMSGGGMAESDAIVKFLDSVGLRRLNMDLGATLMQECSRFPLPQVAIAGIDWGVLRTPLPSTAKSTRFAHLSAEAAAVSNEQAAFRAAVLALPEEERGPMVTKELAKELANVLKVDVDSIDPTGPIADLGIDSLMAVEFAARAGKQLNIQISAFQFTPDLTLEAVGARVALLIAQGVGDPDHDGM
ncbi:Phthiocerol synthesis polyketide synthase type I PpsC [Mycobacteroides franklinii]|uniref:Phthiocerol synthesis polyketide synthase type I PpsC n=1 Tax=Mycobacteroides franklinii TaxID=948102 RepID=A0A4R8RC34_9MYCO|nr:Phthiocerol synthesis polyketide synthase type I PpsC [Mycobacteroides franklinii]TDZ52890.1 Phthiocerol synthesis polyketide synthase type I PpsC [Mycobacteroides franklinii]TDZ56297.1 Phthiocerol synthesis polyketide synthase type I PpsC [Mycobacteroides franklinii]TDZ63238.1 Phthiocerol synthesis polyketide synthase type I PpsC [Mycobacteroides franklinii]TDZ69635.1 Phthiocerol synthesis polyketide synthase type I PpsC [Mycobacteroides franklinii]